MVTLTGNDWALKGLYIKDGPDWESYISLKIGESSLIKSSETGINPNHRGDDVELKVQCAKSDFFHDF